MIREMTMMFALALAGCGSDDDGDSSTNAGSTNAGSTSSGGMTSGSGGTTSAGGGGSTGADATTGDATVCERGCEATLEADCESGPSDFDQCLSDCQDLTSGGCSEQYAAFQACAEGESVTCAQGFPVVAACADEQADFGACLTQ